LKNILPAASSFELIDGVRSDAKVSRSLFDLDVAAANGDNEMVVIYFTGGDIFDGDATDDDPKNIGTLQFQLSAVSITWSDGGVDKNSFFSLLAISLLLLCSLSDGQPRAINFVHALL
jgi:hypothetical protein